MSVRLVKVVILGVVLTLDNLAWQKPFTRGGISAMLSL